MYLLRSFIVALTAAQFASAGSESACSSRSTVTTTVTAPPVTETVRLIVDTASSAFRIASLIGTKDELLDVTDQVTGTSTSFLTLTKVISTVQETAVSKTARGPWYFYLQNGTTSWLGGTPPASISLATSTTVVYLEPVPTLPHRPASRGGLKTITTKGTAPSRTFSMPSATVMIHEALVNGSSAGKTFRGIASGGWNATLAQKVFSPTRQPSGQLLVLSSGFPSGLPNKAAQNNSTTNSLQMFNGSGHVSGNASPNATVNVLRARDLGSNIVATIDGAAESWANNYDGSSETATSPTSTPTSSATRSAVGAYPWNLAAPVPKSVVPGSAAPTSPKTSVRSIVGVYPWNLPTPVSKFIFPGSNSSSPGSASTVASSLSTSPSASASSTSCSGSARFTINFDDLPRFSTGPNDTEVPPILDPYHDLFFDQRFGYVPPPSDPYRPISEPQLAIYQINNDVNVDQDAGGDDELIGEFGSGPREDYNSFWFDAFSVYLGCKNAGPADCVIYINGYIDGKATRVASQTVVQPPCPALKNCALSLVQFGADFRRLTGVQILASVDRGAITWYMDNLQLGWSNNSCAAQAERFAVHGIGGT